MEKIKKYILFVSGGIFFAFLLILAGYRIPTTLGEAPSGLPANVATSSLWAVSTTPGSMFATSTGCSSRIITSSTSNLAIVFTQKTNFQPSSIQGHLQKASTTQEYDSGIYGCDAWRIYGYGSENITITETQ